MILNPSLLFGADMANRNWRRVDRHPSYLIWDIPCFCEMPADTDMASIETLDAVMVYRVTMKMTVFNGSGGVKPNHPRKQVRLWTGSCAECKTVYWTCDSFDWVAWLTDADLLRTVLNAVPIQTLRYENGVGGPTTHLIVHEGTIVIFEPDGSIRRVLSTEPS